MAASNSPKRTYAEYPLGLGLIGTVLRMNGHRVSVLDQGVEHLSDKQMVERVLEHSPHIIGFSVLTPNYNSTRCQIKALTVRAPDIAIIAGGIHATLFPEALIQDGCTAVVLGHGESVILELMQSIQKQHFTDIPGVVFKDSPPSQCLLPKAANNIGDLPIVDRSLFNQKLYTHHSMMVSRGCPARCTFCCGYDSVKCQVLPSDKIIEEMRMLETQHEAKDVFFADDSFLFTGRNIIRFCDQYSANALSSRWVIQQRADVMTELVAETLHASGCCRVYIGAESGSDEILSRTRKGITVDQIKTGITNVKRAGLRVKTGWIYGLPGALQEQYKSLSLMLELRPHDISIHQLIPFPGTEYYKNPKAYGISFRDPRDFASFSYGGISHNISYEYLPTKELIALIYETATALEKEGYVSADKATAEDEYVYTTPLDAQSLQVFSQA